MSDSTLSKNALQIERIFDAPVDYIWQLWTQPELFKSWYGPQGFSVPIAKMDIRVGGKRLFCMQSPDGNMKMWLAGEYIEIVPNKRLVYTEHMADEYGNLPPPSADGGNKDFLITSEITVLLEDLGGRTKMVMTHANVPGKTEWAKSGWEQAFDKMAAHLETLPNQK